MSTLVNIPNIGLISSNSGFIPLQKCSDGNFCVGAAGVVSITATGDRKVEFIAFEDNTLDMDDPKDFYDAIITAGFPLRKGEAGTLGELSPKPHPWLYAEVARVGLGVAPQERHSVVGIEDSGAGVCSIRLAGFSVIGISDGNIIESGTKELCSHYCNGFQEIMDIIKNPRISKVNDKSKYHEYA